MLRLLSDIHFNGKVSVIIQNGQVLKSGYRRRVISGTILQPEVRFTEILITE